MIFWEKWHTKKIPTISFEFFPPRSEKAAASLNQVIDDLVALKPDFVSVTFGAGGSTCEGSFELAKHLSLQKEVPVTAYLAGICLTESQVKKILDDYHAIDVKSVLCVRGDNPHDEELAEEQGDFEHATELLTFVKTNFEFRLGAAGYPEGHVEAESKQTDWDYLKLKVDKGAQYIISQYFYDNNYFYEFVDNCRRRNIDVPIVAGVMPIYSVKMMENLAAMCGATITKRVRDGLALINTEDKEAMGAFGIQLALQQCRELLERGVEGLHFYTMDRSQSVTKIVEQLRTEGLLPVK